MPPGRPRPGGTENHVDRCRHSGTDKSWEGSDSGIAVHTTASPTRFHPSTPLQHCKHCAHNLEPVFSLRRIQTETNRKAETGEMAKGSIPVAAAAASGSPATGGADPVTESSMEVDESMNDGTPKSEGTSTHQDDDVDAKPAAAAAASSNGDKKKKAKSDGGGSAKKRRSVGTASALNKSYIQIVMEAIVEMKDRTGSSLAALKKWIATKYPELAAHSQFNNNINKALRNGLNSKPPKLTKHRASYKISQEHKEVERNKKRRAKTAKAAVTKKKKEESAAKRKESAFQKKLNKMSPEEAAALKKAKEEEEARKAAAEAKAKERSDRLRRRRFPMEDTKLHREDKELNVKPPADVLPRPYLPFFWHTTAPMHHPSRQGKTSDSILRHSKVEGLDSDTRGLVPDMFSVYHFFRGDVHFTMSGGNTTEEESPEDRLVPEFSLKQLIFAVEQVMNGNARKAKLVPPLLVHLFVTCLQILCEPLDNNGMDLSKNERQLRDDLSKTLYPALTPASWADITHLYMDAMQRYYATDASRDPNVLPPAVTDIDYLLGRTDEPAVAAPSTPGTTVPAADEQPDPAAETVAESHPLPDGYHAYLGDTRGKLYQGYIKLARQDPWSLSAEELLALLRALTDDVLATHPAASRDLADREAEMQELLRAKRSAEMKFRKVRLAYEGPKRPPPTKPKAKEGDDGNNDNAVDGEENKPEEEKPFKPTASKRQFETAKKAQEKASDAYEKGIRKLVARTEPIGYDRNFNAVYCFRHDPEILFVEDHKPSASHSSDIPSEMQFSRYSWHVIETTSLLDQFTSSLDIRGRREHGLYEELLGPPGSSSQSLRRFLYDDVKEEAQARAKIKEMESLKERLAAARIKCDEEQGRRSGRLAGQAEVELTQIQAEIDDLERLAAGTKSPVARDYDELTGFDVLKAFEMEGRVETRRTREKKAIARSRKLPLMRCTKLVSTGNIDGTGLVGMLVSSMLELEEHCESLAPWERKDVTRAAWISRLEGAVPAWNSICEDATLGSPGVASPSPAVGSTPSAAAANGTMDDSARSANKRRDSAGSNASKRRKTESPAPSRPSFPPTSTYSVSTILTMLKQPLMELEARVADITNVAVATRDADLADDNMSTDSAEQDEANKERLERAWKKPIHKLRHTPAKKHAQIRELLVAAIGAARKAHLPQVVAGLRAALLQYHPGAPSDCKFAATKVLEANGDYEEDEDDESDDEEDASNEEPKEEAAPSVISAEAEILRSCLGGSDDFTREDWINDVKHVKSVSRLAALTAGFVKGAMGKIEKLEVERDSLQDALQAWNKSEERLAKQRESSKSNIKKGPEPKEIVGPSEVWANVRTTDEICMAKAEDFPWWPAKKCEAKDPKIAESLSNLDRCLLAFVGEMGALRVVKTDQIQPFTGKTVEEGEDVQYSKDMRTELDDCMAMARRILRGRRKKA